MKAWLRRLLGIDEDLLALHKHLQDIHDEIIGIRSDLTVTFYDETDPRRKAMSDKIGQRVIDKLKAEDWARRHALGEV